MVRPSTARPGVEWPVDRPPQDAREAACLRAAVNEHGLVLLRGLADPLDASAIERLARLLHPDAALEGASPLQLGQRRQGSVAGHPKVRRLGNGRGALLCRTGAEWHSDGPGAWTILSCRASPARGGGDTLFADARAALARLPPDARRAAQAARVVYSTRFTAGGGVPSAVDFEHGLRMNAFGTRLLLPARSKVARDGRPFVLPLVLRDRATGEPFLSVDIRHAERLEGLDVARSRARLDAWLRAALGARSPGSWCARRMRATRDDVEFDPNVVRRVAWRAGDVAVWSNDRVLHSPTATMSYEDDAPGSREMLQLIYSSAGG